MTETYPPLIIPPRRALTIPPVRPFNTDEDCVVCLLPDEGTQWRDYSGNSNHAVNSGATAAYNCRRGPGWSFDGVNDVMEIAHSTSIADFTALSVSMWIYPTDIGGTGTLRTVIAKGGAGNGVHKIQISDATAGKVRFVVKNSLGVQKVAVNNYLTPASKWYHVVCVYDGAYITIYINGVAGTPVAQTGTLDDVSVIQIGQASNDFAGLWDELLYFRRALTQQEINALFQAGRPLGV